MCASREELVNFGRFNFESVKEFVYLCTQINNSNNTGEEISRSIASANRGLFGLSAIIRSKLTSKNTKLMIYIQLYSMYKAGLSGCELFSLTASKKNLAPSSILP